VELAKRALQASQFETAIMHLQSAKVYPPNLGEGKLAGARENHLDYYLGEAYAGLDDSDQAQTSFERASAGSMDPASPLYYNDQPPEMIFYQGMARLALGHDAEANA